MLPLGRRDRYGLAMSSAVFLLKNGMHCEFFKETVMHHIKGPNCKTSSRPRFQASRFQASQWLQSLGEAQSCFCETFCLGSHLLTSSLPATPALLSSGSLEDEWVKEYHVVISDHELNLRALNYGPGRSSFSDTCLFSNIGLEIRKWDKLLFMYKRKATDPGLFMRQQND